MYMEMIRNENFLRYYKVSAYHILNESANFYFIFMFNVNLL